MKLSKKGQIKIGESLCIFGRSLAGSRATALAQFAFEPDDFEGVVVLTVEEAKEILQSSYDVLSWANCPCIHKDNALNVQTLLKHRIEQAEMSKEST